MYSFVRSYLFQLDNCLYFIFGVEIIWFIFMVNWPVWGRGKYITRITVMHKEMSLEQKHQSIRESKNLLKTSWEKQDLQLNNYHKYNFIWKYRKPYCYIQSGKVKEMTSISVQLTNHALHISSESLRTNTGKSWYNRQYINFKFILTDMMNVVSRKMNLNQISIFVNPGLYVLNWNTNRIN